MQQAAIGETNLMEITFKDGKCLAKSLKNAKIKTSPRPINTYHILPNNTGSWREASKVGKHRLQATSICSDCPSGPSDTSESRLSYKNSKSHAVRCKLNMQLTYTVAQTQVSNVTRAPESEYSLLLITFSQNKIKQTVVHQLCKDKAQQTALFHLPHPVHKGSACLTEHWHLAQPKQTGAIYTRADGGQMVSFILHSPKYLSSSN